MDLVILLTNILAAPVLPMLLLGHFDYRGPGDGHPRVYFTYGLNLTKPDRSN